MNSLEFISFIKNNLSNWFNFPKDKLFCQVASLKDRTPQIRTMALYDFTQQGSLVFITDTSSPKWEQLSACDEVSVCMLNPVLGQILAEGRAQLHTSQTNLPMVTLYWENYLDQYWRNFYQKNESSKVLNSIPTAFGIVKIEPKSLELLTINSEDFLRGSREKYEKQGSLWIKNQLSLI
ncbi:MAG: pyridoxamine 5'-phosphate oxidase family protein [Tatlockia sp.]|nr:pyridoxamine 5'-phosphate oxidase family protein [Tatlockia sp.]